MKRGLLVFLAMCALTIAMVPRDKRAVNPEEQETTTEKKKQKTVCAPETPCGWAVYRPSVKIIDLNITNTYCVCGVGTQCVEDEYDMGTSAYVHRCRAPETVTTTDSNVSDS